MRRWHRLFAVRSFRFQWSADLATSWGFEMEALILGWYISPPPAHARILRLRTVEYVG
jgi:hypothetical protein